MRLPTLALFLIASLLLSFSPEAGATEPILSSVTPPGGTTGTEVVIDLIGNRLDDAEEILFHEAGLSFVAWESREAKKVRARIAIATDAEVGEHLLRLRTRTGISEVRTFWVGRLPIVDEQEPNNDLDHAQPIPSDRTVHGLVDLEDIDVFVIDASAGDRISVEIEGMRLGRALFDPAITLLDQAGSPIATCDDTPLHLQDGFVSIVAPSDGRYFVQVRESAFGAEERSDYRLHVGHFPRPRVIYPTGGRPGETMEFTFLGDPTGPIAVTETLPKRPPYPYGLFATDPSGSAPSWNFVRVTGLGEWVEQEPNDSIEAANAMGEKRRGISGILDHPGDVDYFRFPTVEGEHLLVRIMGRTLGSPIDGALWLYDPSGKEIAFNDDRNGPDGNVEIASTAAGAYTIRIADHLGRGGADHVYRVEVVTLRPGLSFRTTPFGRDSQARQVIPVPRGGRYAMVTTVNRRDFSGDVRFDDPKLPAGISFHGADVASDLRSRVVLFECDAEAPLAGDLVSFVGRATDAALNISGRLGHSVEFVIGPPNRTVFYRRGMSQYAVAATEGLPFRVDLAVPKVPLLRDGVMTLKVTATRDDGYDEPITLRMIWKPDGVGAPSTVVIPKGETTADYRIDANSKARLGSADFVILGEAKVNEGTALTATALTPIEIGEPYLSGAIDLTIVPQGSAGQLRVKLTQKLPFDETATIKLVNLPAHASAPELTLHSSTTDVLFPVETSPKTPRGKHKNLFCQVIIERAGEPILLNIAHKGVLRVDPPQAKQPSPPITPQPASGDSPTTLPLSRLEQLRLEAKKRATPESPTTPPSPTIPSNENSKKSSSREEPPR